MSQEEAKAQQRATYVTLIGILPPCWEYLALRRAANWELKPFDFLFEPVGFPGRTPYCLR